MEAIVIADLDLISLHLPISPQVEAIVVADLDRISAAVARGLTRIDETIALVSAALAAAQEVVDDTPAVTAALGALGANLDCAWFTPAYRAPLEP